MNECPAGGGAGHVAGIVPGGYMAKTILIVDDSAAMRQMVNFTLTEAGFSVVEAVDGQDAVKKLSSGAAPNLIITDLNMPNMDGLALIKAARAMPVLKFTPILMLTTEQDAARKEEWQAAGATGWIVKPFNPDQMLTVLEKVLPA
jgi:two-component system chemotaxis response regulator CheY